MKVAVSAEGEELNDNVSDIFARCPFFIIAEIKDKKVENTRAIKNSAVDQMSGAGVTVAQMIADEGVSAVICGNVGPRAFNILQQFQIEVYRGEGKIETVLKEFIEGRLEKIQ